MRPTRDTDAGRAYLDLRRLAQDQGRPTDELLQLYALEGFLERLAASPYRDHLVLKGGVLLAAYHARRATRDIDLQAREIPNDVSDILAVVVSIARRPGSDGLVFDLDSIRGEEIRDEEEYSGVRVSLLAHLASARLAFHVDVNVGDPIWPAPTTIEVPRLLGGRLSVQGYPLHMVLVEKVMTALQRGSANTRWRDFADVYILTGRHSPPAADMQMALLEVAEHRRAELLPLADLLQGFAARAQPRWAAWIKRQRLAAVLPESFEMVVAAMVAFGDPVIADGVAAREWDPSTRHWR